MTTYVKCPKAVADLANEILCTFPPHKPLLDARVTIDFVFAHGERDEHSNELKTYAMTNKGHRVLGKARKVPLKDRALGRSDAEITLDGDWWDEASEPERKALLDHELHHLEVRTDNRGVVRDDLHRPVLDIRWHDYEFGWFNVIAERHGRASQEVKIAAVMFEKHGQLYWPSITKA